MIIAASYAGNLKAFLTNPTYTKPINSLTDIIDSGLPYDMVLYGKEVYKTRIFGEFLHVSSS